MKSIELIRKLEKYPVFTLKILGELIEKNRNYSKLVAYRLKKNNFITEIEKNKYSVNKDPIIIASNIIWPSYLSCWSALRYHNLTEQLPNTIFIMTTKARKKKEINFNNSRIIFIKIKSKYFFGYKKERYGEQDIFMAEKEKAVIDSVLFKKISFSEISSVLKNNINEINMNLFNDYLIKIKNKALIKRFGFLFDKLGFDCYDKLKRLVDAKYIKLDYTMGAEGKKDKKWRIIENVKI